MTALIDACADRIARWTGIVIIVLVGAVTGLVFVSVVLRYGFATGIVWGEEAARYMMIWMGFLGASLALRKGAHVGIDMLRAAMPRPICRFLTLVASLVSIAFFAVIVYQGAILVAEVAPKESVVLPVSMMWFYLAIPVGAVLMLIQFVPLVVREWKTGAAIQATEEGHLY